MNTKLGTELCGEVHKKTRPSLAQLPERFYIAKFFHSEEHLHACFLMRCFASFGTSQIYRHTGGDTVRHKDIQILSVLALKNPPTTSIKCHRTRKRPRLSPQFPHSWPAPGVNPAHWDLLGAGTDHRARRRPWRGSWTELVTPLPSPAGRTVPGRNTKLRQPRRGAQGQAAPEKAVCRCRRRRHRLGPDSVASAGHAWGDDRGGGGSGGGAGRGRGRTREGFPALRLCLQ